MLQKTQQHFPMVYSSLKRIPIIQKGKKLLYLLRLSIKEKSQKRILSKQLKEFSTLQLPNIFINANQFLENMRVKGEPTGRFSYSVKSRIPLLYTSVYGALLYDLFYKIDDLSSREKLQWVDYLNSYQCNDGLYRDPLIENEIAEVIDWWGWRHLSAHVISAISALGGKTLCPFSFLKFLYAPNKAYEWIKTLPWDQNSVNVSNTVMNYGVLLQYERDIRQNEHASIALNEIFSFLEESVNPKTGLWFDFQHANSQVLSDAVQTSYHLWNLFFYDKRAIPYLEKAIDSCLETQNKSGGFGVKYNSSACEDIDSIDPLARFYFLTEYRHSDIQICLEKALRWVSINQMCDGGFVFRRFEKFKYGHELMETNPEVSNLFATWFRLLSIAYISKVLDNSISGEKLRISLHSPGYQFWKE